MAAVAIGALPALPLHEAGKYVAGAYVVVFVLVLVYVAIMAVRLRHIQRELGELLRAHSAGAGERSERAASEAPVR